MRDGEAKGHLRLLTTPRVIEKNDTGSGEGWGRLSKRCTRVVSAEVSGARENAERKKSAIATSRRPQRPFAPMSPNEIDRKNILINLYERIPANETL